MKINELIAVKIFRYDPGADKEPYFQDYEVPFQFDKMKVLDVIRYIQDELDPTLSFTWDCRLWNCGLCGLTVNKKPGSACLIDVKQIATDNKGLVIEPMANYPIIKDLVIDRDVETAQLKKAGITYDRHSGEFSLENLPEEMDPEDVAFFRDWYLACIDCLACTSGCPAFDGKYSFLGPHLCVRIAKYANHPKDEGDRAKQSFDAGIFNCLNCGRCDEVCPLELEVSKKTMEKMKAESIEEGHTPPAIRDFLENMYRTGNPWGLSPYNRGDWAKETGVELFDGKRHEHLLYVGSTGSYDTRGMEVTKKLAALLQKLGISFGILGEEEMSDGNEVSRIGEKGLFEELAEKNIELFKQKGVESIITLSPHSYNSIKNEYPEQGGDYPVEHYTMLLSRLVDEKKLSFNGKLNKKVTFHDSCFLGRYNNEYDLPRKLLSSIPGVELVEMGRIRENSFCCGGGGGNYVTDLIGGESSPSRSRVREAYDTGADTIVVTCPICVTMFEDAIKTEGLEEKLAVKDLSELMIEALS